MIWMNPCHKTRGAHSGHCNDCRCCGTDHMGCTGTMPVTKNANGVMTTIQNRMDNSDKYYGRNYFETVRTVPYNGRCVGGGPKSGD